jgi:hypothetical protein
MGLTTWLRSLGQRGKAASSPPMLGIFTPPYESTQGAPRTWDGAEYAKAMGDNYPFVYACVNLIASSLARLPLTFSQVRGKESAPLETGPLPALFDYVNPRNTLTCTSTW